MMKLRRVFMGHKSQIMYHAVLLLLGISTLIEAGIPDTPFMQEYHQPYPIPGEQSFKDVRGDVIFGAM